MGKSKLYSMLLSVVIAFGLWLYVVNNVSQETEATFYNIPVAFEREAALDERMLGELKKVLGDENVVIK